MPAKPRIGFVTVLLMFGVALAGCDSGMVPGPSDPNTPGDEMPSPNPQPDPKPNPEPEPDPEPTLVGIWQVESGTIIPGLDTIAFARAMTLNEDGTGRVFLQDRNEEFPNCVAIEFLFDGNSLLIDFVSLNNPLATFVYPIVFLEADELRIAGQNNPVTTFRRVAELPAEYVCRASRPVRRFDNLATPISDLAYLDGALYFTSFTEGMSAMIEKVDSATGAVGTPTPAGARPLVHTAQPDGIWGTCACGSNTDSALSHPMGMGWIDTVDTDADFDQGISIEQMAYDAVEKELWLYGWLDSTGYVFMQVDATGEPNVLIDTLPFEAYMTGLAHYKGDLWALATVATPSIVRIDPATGEIIASYEVPDYTVTWNGLTFDDNGRLYLLGETIEEKGVIVEAALD